MRTKGRQQSSNIKDRRPSNKPTTIENVIWHDKVVEFRNESFESARQKKTTQPYNRFSK